MLRDTGYVEAFAQLRKQTKINRHLSQIINPFVYHMYGCKWNDSTVEIRYQMYWQSGE